MGVDYSTHLGPYAECKTSKVAKEYQTRSCTNNNCKLHGIGIWNESKYCQECGTKIGKVKLTKPANKIERHKVREEMKEALYDPLGDPIHQWMDDNDTDLWLPNRKRESGVRSFSFDPRDGIEVHEISATLIQAEITEFAEQQEVQYEHGLGSNY